MAIYDRHNSRITAKQPMNSSTQVEKATAHHPAEKQMAEHKKQLKIHEAELAKHEAKEHNAAVREHAHSAHIHPSQGPAGIEIVHPTGGYTAGTARPSAAHSPMVETGYPGGHGPGPYPA
jgi:Late embryogenesis abundant (LEA) group 1